ncbi:hypothetical protein AHF37_11903, partial [Paragonimus kellicotti]
HSNTRSSRQVPGSIAAAPVADNLLPATPARPLSGSKIVDQEEQSTGVNRTSPTSLPVPSSTKPDRALNREHVPVRSERVPSLDLQLDAEQPIKPKLCGLCDFSAATTTLHVSFQPPFYPFHHQQHSNTRSSRQVPGSIAAAPVADNLLPATPVRPLSGSKIVDQEEQSTGVNRTSPTSLPVPSSTKPDRALNREHVPVRSERVPSLDLQLDAEQPIKPKLVSE